MPKTHLKVVGAWGNLSQYKNFELPFWSREITERSKGAVTAEITPFNEMGLKGAEIFRLMRLGVIDFRLHGARLCRGRRRPQRGRRPRRARPGRRDRAQGLGRHKPVYDKFYREKFGIQVLGIWPYPA
ncbi:MAG: hypothetical protein M5U08_14035 [Burkholderiales bacterium]|nr:hypothetical protein [Burkholderiales bacterium]